MSLEQLNRYHVIQMVIEGKMSLAEAAQSMQLSYRQAKRIKANVVAEGASGVLHHNHGRTPANKLPDGWAAPQAPPSGEPTSPQAQGAQVGRGDDDTLGWQPSSLVRARTPTVLSDG